ncbi:MAG: DUF3078 domain-containing protein [Bacteroidota bacterium]|nr:DUF3078 domain-containing protein [Bacteroidota bacterium]
MKRHLSIPAVVCILLTTSLATFGQEPSTAPDTLIWKKKLNFSVNLNQASFSSNWKAGGINAFGFNSLFNYKANYKKDRNSWDNDIDLAFGFVNNSGQGYRKTIDRIFLDTKYGYELGDIWSLYSSLNFSSQFADGYIYADDNTAQLISGVFAPAFITASLGFEYHPVEYFKVRISPFSPRITIVHDPARFVTAVGPEPYGVVPPETVRFEWFGFQLMAEFDKKIYENVNFKWRYLMFANYETIEARTIDHRLDLDLIAKVGKYINVGLGGILLYDYDQDSGAQVSQVFSIGFIYTFQNYVEKK